MWAYKIFKKLFFKLCNRNWCGTDQTKSKANIWGLESQHEFRKCIEIHSQQCTAGRLNRNGPVGQSPAHKTCCRPLLFHHEWITAPSRVGPCESDAGAVCVSVWGYTSVHVIVCSMCDSTFIWCWRLCVHVFLWRKCAWCCTAHI